MSLATYELFTSRSGPLAYHLSDSVSHCPPLQEDTNQCPGRRSGCQGDTDLVAAAMTRWWTDGRIRRERVSRGPIERHSGQCPLNVQPISIPVAIGCNKTCQNMILIYFIFRFWSPIPDNRNNPSFSLPVPLNDHRSGSVSLLVSCYWRDSRRRRYLVLCKNTQNWDLLSSLDHN